MVLSAYTELLNDLITKHRFFVIFATFNSSHIIMLFLRSLRSSIKKLLKVPRKNLKAYGYSSFSNHTWVTSQTVYSWPQQPWELPSSVKPFVPVIKTTVKRQLFSWIPMTWSASPIRLPSMSQHWAGSDWRHSACLLWVVMMRLSWSFSVCFLPSIVSTTIFPFTCLSTISLRNFWNFFFSRDFSLVCLNMFYSRSVVLQFIFCHRSIETQEIKYMHLCT